jgi:glycosyltransferase involved in cell wall biosynthesis
VSGGLHSRPKVALLLLGAGDISGGGGAERQFADLFDHYSARVDSPFGVSLITDRYLFEQLRATGRLSATAGVVVLGNQTIRPHGMRTLRGVGYVVAVTVRLLASLLGNRYDIVHVCMPLPAHLPAMALLRLLPRRVRPLITVMVIDCTLANGDRGSVLRHGAYLRGARPDGVFTWYEKAKDVIDTFVGRGVPVRAARFCFADTSRFHPASEKARDIVWAGRMDEQKEPLFFVEAVQIALQRAPQLFSRWSFRMFGRGPLEASVKERIAEAGLERIVGVAFASDLAPTFAASSIYVSTQKFENFTSLSMMEAMAAGNAIASRDVGQTGYFVRDDVNGLLLEHDTPEGLAETLIALCGDEERTKRMQQESRRLATSVHNVEHFMDDIEAFWRETIRVSG